MSEERPHHHGDLRAALEALGGREQLDVSLREVGRAVGVSGNAAYCHSDGKPALLAAVAAEGLRVLERAFDAAAGDAALEAEAALEQALDI